MKYSVILIAPFALLVGQAYAGPGFAPSGEVISAILLCVAFIPSSALSVYLMFRWKREGEGPSGFMLRLLFYFVFSTVGIFMALCVSFFFLQGFMFSG